MKWNEIKWVKWKAKEQRRLHTEKITKKPNTILFQEGGGEGGASPGCQN